MKLRRGALSRAFSEGGDSGATSPSPCPAMTSHTEDVVDGFKHTCRWEPRVSASCLISGPR